MDVAKVQKIFKNITPFAGVFVVNDEYNRYRKFGVIFAEK